MAGPGFTTAWWPFEGIHAEPDRAGSGIFDRDHHIHDTIAASQQTTRLQWGLGFNIIVHHFPLSVRQNQPVFHQPLNSMAAAQKTTSDRIATAARGRSPMGSGSAFMP